MRADVVVHIAARAAWEQAQGDGVYRAESLDHEGFIHCSTPAQVVAVAAAFYAGRQGLVLLCIDPARLRAELRYEAPAGGRPHEAGQRFPHLYGPLNLDAVVAVYAFSPGPGGTFTLPEGLR